MARAAFKENLEQITLPTLETPKESHSAVKNPVEALLFTASKIQSFATNDAIYSIPTHKDITQKEYEDDMSPDTKSENVLRLITDRIVHKRETAEQREEDERAENFGFTKNELNRLIAFAYMELGEPKATYEQSPYLVMTTAGYHARESTIGQNGKSYTNVYDDKGNFAYADGNNACYMNKGGPASTIQSAQNDSQFDSIQQGTIKYKLGADGQLVERTEEEANIQKAFATIDNKYTKFQSIDDIVKDVTRQPAQNDPSFLSATASGITTPVTPTEPFKAAVSATDAPAPATKSIMFTKNPMPWDVTKLAVNAPAYEPSF